MNILLTALLALLLQLVLPWWSLTFAAAGVAWFRYEKPLKSFFFGFLGIFLLWFSIALIVHFVNEGILSNRLATLFNLPSPYLPVLITGLLGGFSGGFAALTGSLLRKALVPN